MKERLEQVRQQIVYNWPYYGPRIIGGTLVLLIVLIGYLLWIRSRTQPAEVAQQVNPELAISVTPTPMPLGGTEPNAQVKLEGTPTPTSAAVPEVAAIDSTKVIKGGVEKLPETGFPIIAFLPGSLLALAGGLGLSRFKKS